MKKYKVKNTSIMHNGSVAKEGDIIELSDIQAKKLADFIELIPESKKQETKTDDNSQTSEETPASVTDGENDGK